MPATYSAPLALVGTSPEKDGGAAKESPSSPPQQKRKLDITERPVHRFLLSSHPGILERTENSAPLLLRPHHEARLEYDDQILVILNDTRRKEWIEYLPKYVLAKEVYESHVFDGWM